jgi:hypothetical protein
MAIKGKSKTRNRPKQVARAPRHEPVVVKPPLLARRWVMVVAAALVGAFGVMVVIWATNNVREEHRANEARAAAQTTGASKRTAALAWQAAVTDATSPLGQTDPSLPPNIFVDMNKAIDQMVKGKVPPSAVKTFQTAQKNAAKSVKGLSNFDLAAAIKDKGFEVSEAQYFTESKDRLIAAIQTYQRAAEAALLAAKAPADQLKGMASLADHLRSDANTQLQSMWTIYQSALGSAGISPKPPAGLGGG